MTQYQRGYRFELQTKKRWEERGYWVIRAAGSHGVADLVALKNFGAVTEIVLIQCKLKGKISLQDRKTLLDLAMRLRTTAVLSYKDSDNKYQEEVLYCVT